MKLVTALFCFAIITCVEMPDGVGQSLSQSHYDSLASQLSALKGSDRIDAFIELAMMISNDSVKLIPKDSAEIYLLMARSEAMRSVDSLTKARVYLHLGIITYRKLTFRKEALAYLDTALTYLPERGDRSVYADIIYYKALVYQDSQNHEHAMELYLEILPIYLRTNNYMQQGLTYNKIALLHTYKADNKNGVVYFLKAVERFDAGHIIHIYAAHNLASCGRAYYRMGDDANALQKFFEAVAMFESLKDDPGQSYMLQSIGQVYFRQKKYEDALNYHFKALALSKTSNHKQAWGEALCNIAETYWKQGNNQKSIEYINQALNLDLKHNSFGLPRDYRLLGDIYFGLKQYDRSLWYYQQSLHFSDSVRLNRLSAI
ncbi:MAG: tetratricopeptide repeat protein, partial [Bacteroidota bacterium]